MIHIPIMKATVASAPSEFVASTTTYSSSTNSINCNVPTGTQDGNIMLAFLNLNYNSAAPTTPTGWTLLSSVTSSPISATMLVYYRTASSEPSSYTFNGFTTTRTRVSISTYTDGQIDTHSFNKDSGVTLDATAITTSVDNCLVVYVLGADDSATISLNTPPSGMTEDADHTGSGFIGWCSGVQASAGSTGVLTAACSVFSNYGIALISIKPN